LNRKTEPKYQKLNRTDLFLKPTNFRFSLLFIYLFFLVITSFFFSLGYNILLFSDQGETMQCAVWKDELEQTESKTAAVSIFGFPKKRKKQVITKNK